MTFDLNFVHIIEMQRRKIYRAKLIALKMVSGDYAKSYTRLHDYANIIKSTNPGSIALVDGYTPDPPIPPTFN